MNRIEIDGKDYIVVENLGFIASANASAVIVNDSGSERTAVRTTTGWRFWTLRDRVAQLGGQSADAPVTPPPSTRIAP